MANRGYDQHCGRTHLFGGCHTDSGDRRNPDLYHQNIWTEAWISGRLVTDGPLLSCYGLCSGCSLRTTGGTVHRGDIHRTTGDPGHLFIVFLNTLGSKIGGSIQIIFTVCKMIPLILLIVLDSGREQETIRFSLQ